MVLAATRWGATSRSGSRSPRPSGFRGSSSPARRASSSAASRAGCLTIPTADFVRERMEEIFFDPSLRHARMGGVGAGDRRHAGLGPSRPALRARRPPGQCRGAARRDPAAHPADLGAGGPHHAAGGGGALPPAHPRHGAPLALLVRPRADAGVAGQFAAAVEWLATLLAGAPGDDSPDGGAGYDDRIARRAPMLEWWAARRRQFLEQVWRRPAGVQEERLLRLITTGARHGVRARAWLHEHPRRSQSIRRACRSGTTRPSSRCRSGRWGGARRDLARRGPPVGQDLGHHRRRQAHPGDTRSDDRTPEGRLGHTAARRGARMRREPNRWAHALPRR